MEHRKRERAREAAGLGQRLDSTWITKIIYNVTAILWNFKLTLTIELYKPETIQKQKIRLLND